MSRVNSRKTTGSDQRSANAGATSRLHRGAGSGQSGRRVALMNVLNAMYAPSNRAGTTNEGEGRNQTPGRDR